MDNLNNLNIIFFDGVCNLCNSSVQFIIKRNKKQQFYYASLQSDVAKEILLQHLEKKITLNTIVFVEKGNVYAKSTCILQALAILFIAFTPFSNFRHKSME